MTSSQLTHRTIYREHRVIVTLREDGTILSVTNDVGYNLTGFMTDDQKTELARQCREEGE